MKIECPDCQTQYQLDEKKIPATGATVPCKKCKAKISVKPPSLKLTSEVTDQTTANPAQSFTENLKSQASAFTDKAMDYGDKIKIGADRLKSKLAEKKNHGQPVELSKDGIKSRVNAFLIFSFKVGKFISAFSLVLFFLLFIGSVAYYFINQMHSFSPPDYEQARRYLDKESQNAANTKNYSFAKVDEKRNVQDKYDKVIRKIISYGLKEEAYEIFLDNIMRFEGAYQADYIQGLEKYLQNWSELNKQKQNSTDIITVIKLYERMFSEKLQASEMAKQQAAARNYVILGVIGASLVLYILFLLIPLMIKIEENTRIMAREKPGGMYLGENSPENLHRVEIASHARAHDDRSVTAT
jgi:predicted Zn finger-like uncharacterized protein